MSVEEKLEALEKRLDEKVEKHSVMWLMAENAKRWFVMAMTVLVLWFATIGVFVWYLNQYDYSTTTYTSDSQDGGNAIINGGGDVTIHGEGDKDDKK